MTNVAISAGLPPPAPAQPRVTDGVAEPLPLDDHGADAAVASVVPCSVERPHRAVCSSPAAASQGSDPSAAPREGCSAASARSDRDAS
jgi:hypothetical protein